MCLMLCKAGNKRLEAEVYIGADTLCYYFSVLVCWEFFSKGTYASHIRKCFFYLLSSILICHLAVMLYEKHLPSSLCLAVAFLSLKASGIKLLSKLMSFCHTQAEKGPGKSHK